MQKLKTKSVFIHIVEYYTDNQMVRCDNLNEVNREKLSLYWKAQKESLSQSDNKFVELENFTAVTKCVRGYDYSVHKIVERVDIDNN